MAAAEFLERDLVKCEDMRLHAQRAREFLGERTLEEFLHDALMQAAVVRCVEVVGEAARAVSEETRGRAPGIPQRILDTHLPNPLVDDGYQTDTRHTPTPRRIPDTHLPNQSAGKNAAKRKTLDFPWHHRGSMTFARNLLFDATTRPNGTHTYPNLITCPQNGRRLRLATMCGRLDVPIPGL